MTRTNILASMLYRIAVSLKNMNFSKLVWKHNREKLISTLSAMQFITGCIGLKNISLTQTEEIISILSLGQLCGNQLDRQGYFTKVEGQCQRGGFEPEFPGFLGKIKHGNNATCLYELQGDRRNV